MILGCAGQEHYRNTTCISIRKGGLCRTGRKSPSVHLPRGTWNQWPSRTRTIKKSLQQIFAMSTPGWLGFNPRTVIFSIQGNHQTLTIIDTLKKTWVFITCSINLKLSTTNSPNNRISACFGHRLREEISSSYAEQWRCGRTVAYAIPCGSRIRIFSPHRW